MINSEVGFQKVRTKNGKAYGDGIYLTNNLSYSRVRGFGQFWKSCNFVVRRIGR